MPERRRSREIERLVEALILRLTDAVESATAARARVLSERYLLAAMADAPGAVPAHASPTAEPLPEVPLPPRRARRPGAKRQASAVVPEAKPSPAIDADEERRTAELDQERRAAELEHERRAAAERARLRVILQPTVPVPPAPPVIVPTPLAATEEKDELEALEDQIRDQLPSLPGLSVSRYTAQIAAWVGRVRLHQSGPDGERTRIASRIMFDKLRNLAWSMEAGPIEGLNLPWSTRNWERYIKDNELIAASPDVPPSKPEPDADADVWATPGETDAQA